MSTHQVPVVEVKLEKHPNADNLSVVKVGGYQVCANTKDWEGKKYGAYIEPDSLVPVSRKEFDFLSKDAKADGYARIKARKIRDVISYGLLVPAPEGTKPGDDVMELLGVKHYDPEVEEMQEELKGGKVRTKAQCAKTPTLPWIASLSKYDLENVKSYMSVLQEGEEVIIREKLDGCLISTTKIMMADGTEEYIKDLVNRNSVGEEILGVDVEGRVTSTPILGVSCMEATEDWLKISGKRLKAGRGGHHYAVTVTPNHRIYTDKGYVEARDIKVGDTVYTLRYDLDLSPLQEQILLGKLLGDGCLHINQGGTAHISFGHKESDSSYIDWTLLGLWGMSQYTTSITSGYGTPMIRGMTSCLPSILKSFKDFKGDTKKVIPTWVKDKLTPISMAFWYMDDGSLSHIEGQEDRVNFSTCAFTEDECKILQEGLKKFDINSVYFKCNKGYSYIRLNAKEAEKFFLLVRPYIPPCMQRKLPERYRGMFAWMPTYLKAAYKPFLVAQKVDKIIVEKKKRKRYDLMTGTSNFFANKIVVHNSNVRVVWWDNQLHVGSRTRWVKQFEEPITYEELIVNGCTPEKAQEVLSTKQKQGATNVYWQCILNTPEVGEFCRNNPGVLLYGECFGNAGKIKYNLDKKNQFGVFDIMKDGRFLDAQDHLVYPELPWAPVVTKDFKVRYDFEMAKALAEEKSFINSDCIREGIVISPIKERWNEKVGRVKMKIVSAQYLLMKGKK